MLASTFALTNATLPYVLELATKGAERTASESAELARGVNLWRGAIVHPAVAEVLGKPATPRWPWPAFAAASSGTRPPG